MAELAMSKRQFEREKARQTRARILALIEVSREDSRPEYVAKAAGFWLRCFPGSPDTQRNFRLRESEPVYFGA
jgi:hypothetical protein